MIRKLDLALGKSQSHCNKILHVQHKQEFRNLENSLTDEYYRGNKFNGSKLTTTFKITKPYITLLCFVLCSDSSRYTCFLSAKWFTHLHFDLNCGRGRSLKGNSTNHRTTCLCLSQRSNRQAEILADWIPLESTIQNWLVRSISGCFLRTYLGLWKGLPSADLLEFKLI